MTIKLSEERTAPAIAEEQRSAMAQLGEDFESLLGPGKKYPDLISFYEATKMNILILHKLLTGTLLGSTVPLGTIYAIAEKLDAKVIVTVPNKQWDHKTLLCALWKMGAKIRLVERSAA